MSKYSTTSDAASVATTTSLASRITILKDKIHSSSAHKSNKGSNSGSKQATESRKKQDVLRNQIRMGI
ncbi:uncharacterized protein C8A04DRAFT_26368 [Dichotomopilus funicola]|uniref:Uncharacterized protein n=1 Tax=Dichotomopilus funicola TaxID=1934379 RepID=A0AAN6ZPW0_9PEZI|nr:hypothetical protein C8A04DRAFT_26368 [Dichotomopilus funicola]